MGAFAPRNGVPREDILSPKEELNLGDLERVLGDTIGGPSFLVHN